MDIKDFIPIGKKNAIKRQELRRRYGASDRLMRRLIALARRETPIINDQSGNGYYIPSADDLEEAKRFLKQEEARAKSIFWSIRGLRKWIKEVEECMKKVS